MTAATPAAPPGLLERLKLRPLGADTGREVPAGAFPSTARQRFAFRWMVLFFRMELISFASALLPAATLGSSVYNATRPIHPDSIPDWFKSLWPPCPGCLYNPMFWQAEFPWAALTALAGAVVWRLLDRDRLDYRKTYLAWRTIVRFTFGVTMIQWGFFKLNGSQFWGLHTDAFLIGRPLGEWSARALMWNTMGQSVMYGMFTGTGEVIGGLLLLFRRTTLLGALVLASINWIVFVLDALMNRGGITGSALWGALLATMLAAIEWRRLRAFYLENAPVSRVPEPRLLPRRADLLVKLAIFVLLAKGVTWGRIRPLLSREGRANAGWKNVPHPLTGLFQVEALSRNGRSLVPRHDDTTQWAFVGIGGQVPHSTNMRGSRRGMVPSALYIMRPDGAVHEGYAFALDTIGRRMVVDTAVHPKTLEGMQFETWQARVTEPFTYELHDIDQLTLRAIISGDTIVARLRRFQPHETTLFGSPRIFRHNYGSPIRWPRSDSTSR
jgi:hypothetical protein